MPVQASQWTEFLSCPICYNEFNSCGHEPISLGCSHTVCKTCLHKLHRKACPFDQTPISTDIDLLPVNCALLQLVGAKVPDERPLSLNSAAVQHYEVCRDCVEEMALYLKPGVSSPSTLSRPMQRKLVTLVNCQMVEEEGRVRAVRAARSLGERTVTELILQHQNPQQLSANLWAAVRARGCQFLGPAMQEDALKLVLLALEDGLALSRKVLVLFVVQKLEARFPQASKTSIGHVVQLLYRASCFKVTKRDEDSSLMQLKEEFRTYEALRREHDAQIVHIAMEAGLRISPEQWSSLLYGDLIHKSHMQSIIDKLQTPESFAKSVQELTIVLQRSGDPANLSSLRPNLELLSNIDHNPDTATPSWEELESVMFSVKQVVHGLVGFIQNFSKKSNEAPQPQTNAKYKTSMCRDLRQQGGCPRGNNCTFAHTQDELDKFRLRNKKSGSHPLHMGQTFTFEGADVCTLEDTEVLEGTPLNHPDSLQNTRTIDLRAANTDHPQDPARRASSESPQKKSRSETPVNQPLASSPLNMTGCAEGCSQGPKHTPFLAQAPHQGLYYQDANSPYDSPQFQPASGPLHPSLHGPHKTCMARFLRSSNVPESSMPPSLGPPPSFPSDLHAPPPSFPSDLHAPPPSFPSDLHAPPPSFPSDLHAPHPTFPSDLHAPHPTFPSDLHAPHPTFPSDLHAPHPTFSSSPGYSPLRERMSPPAFQGAPGHGAPGHGAPGHGAPGHGPPGHGPPGHGAPGHGPPGHGAPGHGAPGHGAPGHAALGHGPPGHGALGHGPPGHGALGHGPPGHGAPGHGALGHGPPGHGAPGQPPYGSLSPGHGVYAPLYDSRRVWRPQLYHREDARSNSLPPEVLCSKVYQPPLKERFNSVDSNYCSAANRDYGRATVGYEDLFRRKQQQWAHHHHHHLHHLHHLPHLHPPHANRQPQSSPVLTMDFGIEVSAESRGSPCMGCCFRGEQSLAHYSPWSFLDSLSQTSTHSCSEHVEVKKKNESGCSVAKPWLHSFDHCHRLKDEDPIIPFSEGPIISKWGAISRASRTGFHTTDPVQATAWKGPASTTAINFHDFTVHLDHSDCRWNSTGSNSSCFLESGKLDVRGDQTSMVDGEKTVSDTVYGLDQDRLMESEPEPGCDIELELCALDMESGSDQQDLEGPDQQDLEGPHQQDLQSQHMDGSDQQDLEGPDQQDLEGPDQQDLEGPDQQDLEGSDQQDLQSLDRDTMHLLSPPLSQDTMHLLSPSRPSLAPTTEAETISLLDKIDIHLLKKMSFRRSVSPSGSGGWCLGK